MEVNSRSELSSSCTKQTDKNQQKTTKTKTGVFKKYVQEMRPKSKPIGHGSLV